MVISFYPASAGFFYVNILKSGCFFFWKNPQKWWQEQQKSEN
jgi:hypothetical protein